MDKRDKKSKVNNVIKIVWEKRYSKTLDNDRFGRWMRIGRVNGATVAIMSKVEVPNKPISFMVKLPNNKSDESLETSIMASDEKEAMLNAEKYIIEYINNFLSNE